MSAAAQNAAQLTGPTLMCSRIVSSTQTVQSALQWPSGPRWRVRIGPSAGGSPDPCAGRCLENGRKLRKMTGKLQSGESGGKWRTRGGKMTGKLALAQRVGQMEGK
eukprot:gene11674-biopygen348